MEHYGFWSLLPPLAAILLAIRTKQVYLSLLLGIWMGWLVLASWNPLAATLDTVQSLVDVFRDAGNTRTIMFSALVGALIIFIQRSGGVSGFIAWLQKKTEELEEKHYTKRVQILAAVTGILIFVESSISVLTVGTLYRPVFDKLKISREKLAYIADSSSAPVCILIPFNAWGAFIMGVLLTMGIERPFATMMHAELFNFYPILAILLVFITIGFNKNLGPMRKAEKRVREEGKVLSENATPMVSEEITAVEPKVGVQPKAINMVIPILVMVLMMPVVLTYTGWEAAVEEFPEAGFFRLMTGAMGQGSGSTAVLLSVITAILVSVILYASQKMFNVSEYVDLTMKGISGMMPLALLMLMAFAISAVCRELHTGQYVADITSAWLSPSLLPFLVFLSSCIIAFSTGTSWGTFGIMLAIAIPMAEQLQADPVIVIAAVMSGGVFGDHCSPISDTTIIASMAAATDHIDHVRTQLPYALIAGGLSGLAFLLTGILT